MKMRIVVPFLLLVSSTSYIVGQNQPASPAVTPTQSQLSSDTPSGREETAAANSTLHQKTALSENHGASSGASESQSASYNGALKLFEESKFDEAIATLKQSIKAHGDSADARFWLGMAYSQNRSYKEAAESFRLATRLRPEWAEAHFQSGTMSYVLGLREQALDSQKRLLQLNSPLANTLDRILKDEDTPAIAAETATQPELYSGGTKGAATEGSLTELSKPAAPSDAKSEDALPTSVYRIGIGDVLDVRILNSKSNRSTLYTVVDGGVIDMPLAGGAIRVVGLTTDEVQSRIVAELKRRAVEEAAQVSVGIRQFASHTIVVTGLVGSPGTKVLRREAVPLYVILAEVQPRLDAGRVVVMREGATAKTVELSNSASLNYLIRPGDVLNLTAKPQEFYYIAGRVNYPGQKPFQAGITLLQAILAAGGIRGNGNSVELSREGENGLLTTAKINLKEIKSGKVLDPKLFAGDRIEVK